MDSVMKLVLFVGFVLGVYRAYQLLCEWLDWDYADVDDTYVSARPRDDQQPTEGY